MRSMALCSARRSARNARAAGLLLDTEREGFQPLEHDPCIERGKRRAGMAVDILEFFFQKLFARQDDATQTAALTIDMLGGRVDDHIGPPAPSGFATWPLRRRYRPPAWRQPHGRFQPHRQCRSQTVPGWSGSQGNRRGCWAASRLSILADWCHRPMCIRRRSGAAARRRCKGMSRTTRWRQPHDHRP